MDNKMTKGKALLLAALTAWPFLVPVIGLLIETIGLIPSTAAQPPAAFILFLVLLYLTPIVVLALLVFYLVYLFTRPQLSMDRKLVWAALLMIGHVFIMPVFWYLHIWRARSYPPMQASSRFSLLVFGPLLIVLLLPLAYLFPMALITEPAIIANTALHWAWVIGPILVGALIFIVGKLFYIWLMRTSSPRLVWIFLWGFFSILSFVAIGYAVIVLRSLLPSDAPPNTLTDLVNIALVLTLIVQPGVIGWLFAATHLWHRFDFGKYQLSS